MDGCSYRMSRRHRAVGASSMLWLLCLLLLIGHGYAKIPYTPSSLLYPTEQNASFAYLLRNTGTQTEFISLAVSEKIDTSNPSYTVLLDKAPFNANDVSAAYISVIDKHGMIKVYAGDCWNSGSSPVLWTFKPNSGSPSGNGTWERFSASGLGGQTGPLVTRPNHLAAGFAYSASNTTESTVFAFGGMCPYQSDTSTFWASAANYSQTMTALVPCAEGHCYQALTTGERAPPIPEAGFTITPLQATYGLSDGELRQQQDFLLIGGHTQNAFLNMSELAIFSAPQDSWSFVTVGSTADTSRADLAFRANPLIEPRSGHTAILSSDGNKVIVFGGWVGNTSVAATPQLAVLEIGGGLGESHEWTWSVPSMIGGPEGLGTYGHGATMLPGGVMMIAGGYKISQLTTRSSTGPELNSQIYLYDVTSDTWASSYNNPLFDSIAETADTSGPDTSESSSVFSRKTGLGVGIGLGVPVVAGLVVLFYYCYRRRGKRRTRDNEIRKLALGAQRAHFWGRGDTELASSIRNPSMRQSVNSDYPWSGNNKSRSTGKNTEWNDNGDAAAERIGLLGDIHVPKRLNRPILNAGLYRPPYLDYKRGDAAGAIHPIDERDEDEADPVERFQTRETAHSLATEQNFSTARNTQVDGPAPEGGLGRESYLSPEQDERTSSNLSDSSGSDKSAKSAKSASKQDSLSGHSREGIRSQDSSTSTTPSFNKRYSSDSYSTAHSTMSQRQAEGEYLLRDSGNPESSRMAGLLSSKPAPSSRPKAAEWIGGGIRRVLSVSRRRPTATEEPSAVSRASGIDSESSGTGTQQYRDASFPRRSVSASAELFRRKQGAKDWGVGNRYSHDTGFHSARSTRDDFGLDGHMDPVSDEDWDVEGAAEGRRVQVTFTVPKEKLRVVNASAGDIDDMSVNSVSRSNSSS